MKTEMIHPSRPSTGIRSTNDKKDGNEKEDFMEDFPSSIQEEKIREWMRSGIAVELEFLQRLSIPTTNESIRQVTIDPAINASIDATIQSRAFVATDANHGQEKTERCTERMEVIASKTRINTNDKENMTANGQTEKLEIGLPFVDWKTILSKAVHSNFFTVEELKKTVSDIVQGWLDVLVQLKNQDASYFCSATSVRSQIYRRLTLLLVGFVGTIGPSSGCASPTDKNAMVSTNKAESTSIPKHTLSLARKILKEEGSCMRKKPDGSFSAVQASQCRRKKSIEADNIYYYCFVTAIAAECCELLGDLDKAVLAYKSIRAIQDRQQPNDACFSICSRGIYTTNRMEIASGATFSNRSPELTVTKTEANTPTKTPTNTPESLVRKKSNSKGSSSWIGNHATCRRSSLFSPKAMMLPFHSGTKDTSSKIGDTLVLPGTLEERILRCSSECSWGRGYE